MQQIQIFNLFPAPFLKKRTHLKQFISLQLKRYGRTKHQLNIIFCDDEYLLGMNNTHLNHDYYTDIITFDLTDVQDPTYLKGELYISVERVIDNAKDSHNTPYSELLRVVFHGILHLLGYKDKQARDIKQMREQEDEWLSHYREQLAD